MADLMKAFRDYIFSQGMDEMQRQRQAADQAAFEAQHVPPDYDQGGRRTGFLDRHLFTESVGGNAGATVPVVPMESDNYKPKIRPDREFGDSQFIHGAHPAWGGRPDPNRPDTAAYWQHRQQAAAKTNREADEQLLKQLQDEHYRLLADDPGPSGSQRATELAQSINRVKLRLAQ